MGGKEVGDKEAQLSLGSWREGWVKVRHPFPLPQGSLNACKPVLEGPEGRRYPLIQMQRPGELEGVDSRAFLKGELVWLGSLWGTA